MIYESRFSLDGYYRIAGIGEIASDISKNGAWVNAINDRGETPLHIAAKYKKYDLFKTMLPYFMKIEHCDNHGNTVLHALLDNHLITTSSKNEKKCIELINNLICKGANINKKNRNGWTPMHFAARNCHIEILNILENAKPDFSLRTDNGETILHLACKNMSNLVDTPTEMEIINNLIIHGCDANAKNDKGYSVLHYAVDWCGVRVVEKLIDCGVDLNCQTKNLQLTPLHLATRKKSLIIIDALIKSGAKVNLAACAGMTPLHLAVIVGSLDIVKVLMENGADVDYNDKWTPLHLAIYLKRKDCFKYLIREQAADVNISSVNGLTPLHFASMLGNFKFVKVLIERGAYVDSRDINNYTPLHTTIKDFHRLYLSHVVESTIFAYFKDGDLSKHFAIFFNVTADRDHKIISKFLIDNKADVNAVTSDNESSLNYAAETGNVKLVKILLKYDVDIDCKENTNGYTPLLTAVYWNYVDVVRELINANADMKVTAKDGKTAIHLAAFYNRVNVVRELVNGNIDVNMIMKDGKTALHLATTFNHIDVVKELLNADVDVNIRANDGKSPLHLAVEKNNCKIFKLLFKHAAGRRGDDKRLRNLPLHIAARENNELMIQYLVEFGSKINAVNDEGYTPLHCAIDKNNEEVASMLIGFDADVNCKTKKYQLTPLHLALHRKCNLIAETLIKTIDDVNVADADGVTPLHLAILNNDERMMNVLFSNGADVHCTDRILQFTPLHIAVNEKNKRIFNALMEAGANVNAVDKHGLTPLHLATILGDRYFVDALIDYGANINCRDVHMYTPLHFAICNKRVMAKVSAKIYLNDSSWISKCLTNSHEFVKKNYDYLADFLIHLGADLNAVTKQGESLLHFAAEANAFDVVKILIERGLEVNFKDKRTALTPLQTAVLHDHQEIVSLLISCGADVKVMTKDGKSLLHLSTESGGTKVLEFLLRQESISVVKKCPFMARANIDSELETLSNVKFNVDSTDYFGMTPLHLAALHSNRKQATEILLIYGASPMMKDNSKQLPIHYAIKNNRYQQLEILLAFGVDVNDARVYDQIERYKIGYGTTAGTRMIQHLMKLKALEFPIASIYELILKDIKYLQDGFYNICLKEVERLRSYSVGNGVSLYNLLHIQRRGRRIYADNIEPRKIEKEFPIYYNLILEYYHKTIVRESLVRKAGIALFQLTEIDLPIVCTDKIFHHLDILSLATLIESAEIDCEKDSRKSLCTIKTYEEPEESHSFDLLCILIYKTFDVCEIVRKAFFVFMYTAAFFISVVPKILYSIFNKWI